MSIPIGYVVVKSEDPPLTLLANLGDGLVTTGGGYGGWEIQDRPKRMGSTEWKGSQPYSLEVPILLNAFENNGSVEAQVKIIETMGRNPGGDDSPPVLSVELPGSVPRAPSTEWVLQDIDWGGAIFREDGRRSRQAATLKFLQYVNDDSFLKITPAKRRKKRKGKGKGKGAAKKSYRVKAGDNLSKIAAKQLGKASRWHEIAKLNHLRDPKKLKVGSVIKLP